MIMVMSYATDMMSLLCNRLSKCIVLFVLLGILFISAPLRVNAKTFDNAVDYYNSYGNNAVFSPQTSTNGKIYFVSRGNSSTSGVKYRTIGWQMLVQSNSGEKLQTLYFKLGGAYLYRTDQRFKGGYEYNLYSVTLDNVRSRLNDKAKGALQKGDCRMIFNACMVVARNSKLGGSMNDNGIVSGKVYTSYKGISEAADWTKSAKTSLQSYYNKSVSNLFYRVSVEKSTGINSVSGTGSYCYGTRITISAATDKGFEFVNWNKNSNYKSPNNSFYVTGNTTWIAYAKPKSLEITFYRNQNSSDTYTQKKTYYYSNTGQRFEEYAWLNSGYHMIGWGEKRGLNKATYSITNEVSSSLVDNKSPKLNLYAVWEPNSYNLVFEGLGCEELENIKTSFGETIVLPDNSYEGYSFKGWSLNPIDVDAKYIANHQVSVSELAIATEVLNTNNATITVYAIWDQIPSMDVYDLYYAKADIANGRVTEASVAANYKAYDYEDGEIAYGVNAGNRFQILNFDTEKIDAVLSEDFSDVSSEAVTIDVEVEDSAGNVVTKTAQLHFVDTSIYGQSKTFGKIRFISGKYYKDKDGGYIKEEAGGLMKNSCWIKLEEYRTLIELALSAA